MSRVNERQKVVLSKVALTDAIKLALKNSPFEDVSFDILALTPKAQQIYMSLDYIDPPNGQCERLPDCDWKEVCDIAAYLKWCQQYLNVSITVTEPPLQLTMAAATITVSSWREKSIYCSIIPTQKVFFEFQ